ncbi:MAG: hypothetical protein R3C32_10850 [Chloroflexota bacterium]
MLNVIGEARGRRAIVVDDEIDTAGTLMEVTRASSESTRSRLCHPRRSVGAGGRAIAGSSLAEVVITTPSL